MGRIQIDLPGEFVFQTTIAVRVTDLNYGSHVGNDVLLKYMQEARVQYYNTMGFKNEISFEGSVGQIIADAAIQYKAESFFGDKLIVKIAISDVTKFGFDMLYEIANKDSGIEVARAKTGIVCFDYTRRKVASIPSVLLEKIKNVI